MMRKLVVIAGLVGLLASPALAQDQAAIMKKRLATAKGVAAVVPTGIEVPGCTWYVLDDRRGGVRHYCHRADARDAARFWGTRDYLSGGSAE